MPGGGRLVPLLACARPHEPREWTRAVARVGGERPSQAGGAGCDLVPQLTPLPTPYPSSSWPVTSATLCPSATAGAAGARAHGVRRPRRHAADGRIERPLPLLPAAADGRGRGSGSRRAEGGCGSVRAAVAELPGLPPSTQMVRWCGPRATRHRDGAAAARRPVLRAACHRRAL